MIKFVLTCSAYDIIISNTNMSEFNLTAFTYTYWVIN